jgi:hypothetical protein
MIQFSNERHGAPSNGVIISIPYLFRLESFWTQFLVLIGCSWPIFRLPHGSRVSGSVRLRDCLCILVPVDGEDSVSMARTLFVFRLYCCLTIAGDWLCLVGSLSLVELLPWFNHTDRGWDGHSFIGPSGSYRMILLWGPSSTNISIALWRSFASRSVLPAAVLSLRPKLLFLLLGESAACVLYGRLWLHPAISLRPPPAQFPVILLDLFSSSLVLFGL